MTTAAGPAGAPGSSPAWITWLGRWWAEFSLQTKLLAVATLVVSLLMTGITFIALNGIQRDARLSDTRYARDLGLLLSANVTPLVARGDDRQLAVVAEQFWRTSRSLRYIFFADADGLLYLGIPMGSGGPADPAINCSAAASSFPPTCRSDPTIP
jgi:two-component system sensor histidine kinase NblS